MLTKTVRATFFVFLWAASAASAAVPKPPEDDPNRFTGVEEWVGTVQTEMWRHDRLSGGDCGTNDKGQKVGHPVDDTVLRARSTQQVRLSRIPNSDGGLIQWGDDGSGPHQGHGHFSWSEMSTSTGCPEENSRSSASGSHPAELQASLSMLILDDEKDYTLIPHTEPVKGSKRVVRRALEEDGNGHKRWKTHVENYAEDGTYTSDGEKSPFPGPPMTVPVGGPISHNFGTLDTSHLDDDRAMMNFLTDPALKEKVSVPLPKRGMTLAGQAVDVHHESVPREEKTDLMEWRMVTRWQLSPKGKAEFDLVLKIGGLDSFVPEGNKDPDQAGNTLTVTAELRDKDGKKAKVQPEEMIFELINTSREPGVCMNRPQPSDSAKEKPDFRFEPSKNAGFAVEDEDAQKMTGPPDKAATISSFDYGGWTTLAVTAVLPGGYPVYGHLEGDSSVMILIPKRPDGSKIASAWKKGSGKDAADEDDQPEGDRHKGDGLTEYEEYRGFYSTELRRHYRTDPKKKNYFFVNKVGPDAKSGTGLFRRISKIDSIELAEEDLCGKDGRLNTVNFNVGEGDHVVDQHGVILEWDRRGESASEAISRKEVPGTPGVIRRIAIGQTFDPEAFKTLVRNGKKITRKTFQRTIAHEMLHSCSVWHHGDRDRCGVEWFVEGTPPDDFISERSIGATGPGFGPLRIFNEFGESLDDELKLYIAGAGPMKLYLGNQRGQHSGVEDCVMRYHVADAYDPVEGGSFVRVWVGSDHELPGMGLCDRREGTGVNAPNYNGSFGPRYGNADYDSKRGRCKEQICVNDAYADSHAERMSDE